MALVKELGGFIIITNNGRIYVLHTYTMENEGKRG
jgi:hypothetical protein